MSGTLGLTPNIMGKYVYEVYINNNKVREYTPPEKEIYSDGRYSGDLDYIINAYNSTSSIGRHKVRFYVGYEYPSGYDTKGLMHYNIKYYVDKEVFVRLRTDSGDRGQTSSFTHSRVYKCYTDNILHPVSITDHNRPITGITQVSSVIGENLISDAYHNSVQYTKNGSNQYAMEGKFLGFTRSGII